MNIKIVGDGGIGSNLSLPLIKLLVQEKAARTKITLIDGDSVEEKNLVRQHFIPEDIGTPKTEVTAGYLTQVCDTLRADHIEVDSFPYYLKKDNVTEMIEENDIVFVGVDNYITRNIIEQRALELDNILVIFGGNEYDDGDVNVYHRENGKEMTPLYSSKHPEILEEDAMPDELGCEELMEVAPQLVLANMSAAQHMLEAFYYFLKNERVTWHERFFDLEKGNVRTVKVKEEE